MLGAENYSGVQLAEQAGAACPVVEHLRLVVGPSDVSKASGADGALISPSALAGGFANAMRGSPCSTRSWPTPFGATHRRGLKQRPQWSRDDRRRR